MEIQELIRRQKEEEERRRKEEEKRRERERREREERERRKKEENLNAINKFRSEQNIADFLILIERFSDDLTYLIKTLEALNEDKVISNYKDFKGTSDGKIQIIKEAIFGDEQLSSNCRRKLVIILLCNEKINGSCDQIFEKLIKKGDKLIFNILIDYSNIFGADISFKLKDGQVYKKFVEYAMERSEYLKSLDYRKNDIIQLKIINENKEKIFSLNDINKIELVKLNEYDGAYELIKDIIKYEKDNSKKLIYFPKTFWENYFIHYTNSEKDDNVKIEKLVGLYELLLSYRVRKR